MSTKREAPLCVAMVWLGRCRRRIARYIATNAALRHAQRDRLYTTFVDGSMHSTEVGYQAVVIIPQKSLVPGVERRNGTMHRLRTACKIDMP